MSKIKEKFNISMETVSAIFIIASISVAILFNFFVGFNLLIFLLVLFLGFIISIFYSRSGIFSIIFLTIIFEQFFTLASIFIGKTEYKFYPVDVLILGVIIGLIIKWMIQKIDSKSIFSSKLNFSDWLLVIFIILNIFYFFANIYFSETSSYLAFSTLKNYAFYSLLYFVSWGIIEKKDDLRRIFRFFLAGTFLVIGFIIFGIINGEGLWTQFTPLSTSGVRILAFTHGVYLSLAFISSLIFLLISNNKFKRVFFFSIIPIWIIGILGTMMRHLWISICFSVFFIYTLISKEKRAIFNKLIVRSLGIIFFIIFIFLYFMLIFPNSRFIDSIEVISTSIIERGASIASASSDQSFAWRELVWGSAYEYFKNSPIFGIGTGKIIYVETENYKDYVEVRNIHNSYLAILIQLGFLGFSLFIWFIWRNLKALWKFIRKKEDFYALSIFGVLIIYLIAFSFQPYLETNLLSIFFWMALGFSRKISANNLV